MNREISIETDCFLLIFDIHQNLEWVRVILEQELEALDADCSRGLEKVAEERSPVLDAGFVRGGDEPVGGITWMDFDREFSDAEIGPPQICGHTACARGEPRRRVRTKGRSWCLDGHQT